MVISVWTALASHTHQAPWLRDSRAWPRLAGLQEGQARGSPTFCPHNAFGLESGRFAFLGTRSREAGFPGRPGTGKRSPRREDGKSWSPATGRDSDWEARSSAQSLGPNPPLSHRREHEGHWAVPDKQLRQVPSWCCTARGLEGGQLGLPGARRRRTCIAWVGAEPLQQGCR